MPVFICNSIINESRNRPGVAQRDPGGLGSQISWHSAHEGDEVVSLRHRPPLHPGNVPSTHFHQGLSRPLGPGTVGRNMSLKNPVTQPGVDPGTVRLVAQRLNHYATSGPETILYLLIILQLLLLLILLILMVLLQLVMALLPLLTLLAITTLNLITIFVILFYFVYVLMQ